MCSRNVKRTCRPVISAHMAEVRKIPPLYNAARMNPRLRLGGECVPSEIFTNRQQRRVLRCQKVDVWAVCTLKKKKKKTRGQIKTWCAKTGTREIALCSLVRWKNGISTLLLRERGELWSNVIHLHRSEYTRRRDLAPLIKLGLDTRYTRSAVRVARSAMKQNRRRYFYYPAKADAGMLKGRVYLQWENSGTCR